MKEWTRVSSQHLTVPSAGPSFFGRIFHPAFNVDLDDAEDTINTFETHARAVGKSVQSLRSVFGKAREARIGKFVSCQPSLIRQSEIPSEEMSKAERLLSYSLLSLITSQPLASEPAIGATQEEEGISTSEKLHDKKRRLTNKDGAWCWRDGCVG